GVGECCELVVAAVGNLCLVLIVTVHQVSDLDRGRQVDRRGVETERRVRQLPWEPRIRLAGARLPYGRQLRERLVVAVELYRLARGRLRDAVGAGEESVEMIKASI